MAGYRDQAPQIPEPLEDEGEVVSGGGEDGVDCIALGVGEVVATHSVLVLDVADDRLDGGAASQLAFDLGRHPALLARGEDPELVARGGVVAPCIRHRPGYALSQPRWRAPCRG